MAGSDHLKGLVLEASAKADVASLDLIAAKAQIQDIAVQLNTAIRAVKNAQRKMLVVIKATRDARELADAAIVGTASLKVANSILWLSQIEDEQLRDIRRLSSLEETLRETIRVVGPMVDDNEVSGTKARMAASTLRDYGELL